MKAHTVNRRNLDRSADLADHTAKFFLQVVVAFKDLFGFAVKYLARRRQFDVSAPADAFEQSTHELLFKCPDLLAYSGLGNKIAFRGKRKALEVNEVAKYFKGFNMHENVGCGSLALLLNTRKRIHFILSYLADMIKRIMFQLPEKLIMIEFQQIHYSNERR